MLDLHVAQQQTLVDQIARIIARGNAAGADEQRIVVGIANREAVDRHAGEESAAHRTEINLPLDRRRELSLNQPSQFFLTITRTRHEQPRDDGHEGDDEKRDGANERNETAAPDHTRARRLRSRDLSRK